MNDHEGALRQLGTAEVESVVFVRDYLQITLYLPDASPRMTFYVWPSIRSTDGVKRDLGDAGYRDELCRLIDSVVSGTQEASESGLVIHFDTGQSPVVRPAWSDLSGPEIAMLHMHDDRERWMVWRPGESPFEADHWA